MKENIDLSSVLSFVTLTKNSQSTLRSCLNSAQILSKRFIIVDDFSTDQTPEIAKDFSADFETRKLVGFGDQKQYALSKAKTDWAFVLDSDETISKTLADLIRATLIHVKDKLNFNAYRVPRKNYYFGQWLRYGGKYPDLQTRLLYVKKCRFSNDAVHEKVIVLGPQGLLRAPLEHWTYPTLEVWMQKLLRFAEYRADEFVTQKKIINSGFFFHFCFYRPVLRFIRRYILKKGFLDGFPGFLACLHDALTDILGTFLYSRKYVKKLDQ